MQPTNNTKQTIQELSQSPYPILSVKGESTQNPSKSPYPILSVKGRKGQSGSPFKGVFGFTLVELIIVITILAILATIAFMSFQGYAKQSRDSNRLTTIKTIEKGVDLFLTKSGKIPAPDEATAFTGGSAENPVTISQGTVGAQMVQVINMNQVPLDPKTQAKYHYSVFGETPYYQIGIEQEQDGVSHISPTFADSEEVMISGNYTFDPILPSLFVVKDSVVSGGLFGTGVCFVVDGGENTFETENEDCETKTELLENGFDKSLVGYWSFDETGFTVPNHRYGGNNFYKDYSGNGRHAFNSGAIQGSGFVAPTQTGGYIGNALYFTSGSIILGGLEKDVFGLPYPEGFTITLIGNLMEYKNPHPYFIETYHSVWNLTCLDYKLNIPCIGQWNSEAMGFQLHSKTLTGAGIASQRGYVPGNVVQTNIPHFYSFTYNGNELQTYLDGQLYGKITRTVPPSFATNETNINHTNRFVKLGGSTLSGNTELNDSGITKNRDFHGIIDEVKIYNRALSDQEIAQQARIAGF